MTMSSSSSSSSCLDLISLTSAPFSSRISISTMVSHFSLILSSFSCACNRWITRYTCFCRKYSRPNRVCVNNNKDSQSNKRNTGSDSRFYHVLSNLVYTIHIISCPYLPYHHPIIESLQGIAQIPISIIYFRTWNITLNKSFLPPYHILHYHTVAVKWKEECWSDLHPRYVHAVVSRSNNF